MLAAEENAKIMEKQKTRIKKLETKLEKQKRKIHQSV